MYHARSAKVFNFVSMVKVEIKNNLVCSLRLHLRPRAYKKSAKCHYFLNLELEAEQHLVKALKASKLHKFTVNLQFLG
jgi:hypothetical protein